MSSSEYISHLKKSTSMMSDSLSGILDVVPASPEGTTTKVEDFRLLITSGDARLTATLVRKVAVSIDSFEASFVLGKSKMLESQSLYGKICSVSYGTINMGNMLCSHWAYDAFFDEDIVVTLNFIKQ